MGNWLIFLGETLNRIGQALTAILSDWQNPAILAAMVVVLTYVILKTNNLTARRARITTIRGLSMTAGIIVIEVKFVPGGWYDPESFAMLVAIVLLVLSVIGSFWLALYLESFIPDPLPIFRQRITLALLYLADKIHDAKYEKTVEARRKKVIDSLEPVHAVVQATLLATKE